MSKLICFAGLDGSGKTTQAQKTYEWLNKNSMESEFIRFHTEPTKVELAEVVKRTTQYLMTHQMMLSMNEVETLKEAFYVQIKIQDLILPTLKAKKNVILDRYYETYSAYSNLTTRKDWIRKINEPFIKPDFYFYVDVLPEVSFERIKKSGRRINDHESIEKLTLARNYYMEHLDMYSFIIIDGNQPVEKIQQDIKEYLK